MAVCELPEALNRHIQELGERKEFLDPLEHEQLMAFVSMSQQRTIEKLQAERALQQLRFLFPDEVQP